MSRLRAAGVAVALAGLLVALVGAPFLPAVPYVLVLGVAVVTVVLGVVAVGERRAIEGEHASTPSVEAGHRVPAPGDALDERRAEPGRAFRRRLAERVRAALIEAGHSPEEAERRLDEGSWTDDPVAAAYLGAEGVEAPLAARLRGLIGGEAAREERAERAVAALARLREDNR
jgi:hypothetical protein